MTTYDDALDRQILACRKAGAAVVLYPGTLTRPHVIDGCDVTGSGSNCVVSVAPGLPGAALTLRNTWNDNRRPVASGFLLRGPGSLILGRRTAGCDGLRVECQAFADNVRAEYFDGGFVWASAQGHIRMTRCTATRNYYGVSCSVGGGDYALDGCFLDGNAWASVGMPGSVGLEGLSVRQTHLGYSPYGVYQEAAGPGQTAARFFLQDCAFDQARFEQVGNGALVSLVTGTQGGPRCETRDIAVRRPGFSWGDGYRLPGVPRDYAVSGDLWWRYNVIDGGAHPFLPGDKAVFGFAQAVVNDENGRTFFDGIETTDNRAMTDASAEAAMATGASAQ